MAVRASAPAAESPLPVLADPDLSPFPPGVVPRAVMIQRWSRVGFVHHPYEPGLIQRLLPPGLEVDTFDGAGWLGMLPFHLEVRLPAWAPALPWASSTLETNLRTYVRGPDGRRGIFFLYLDASRLLAVLTARTWYGIPYRWAHLRFERRGRVIRYQSLRREPLGAQLDLCLCVGERVTPSELTQLERFLICRWRLYSETGDGIAVTEVEHEPWPVRRAEILGIDERLTEAVGLSPGSTPSLAHYAQGVTARFARRRAARTTQPS